MPNVEYIAGGATQNTIRVAQWMLQVPGATTYMGCVGNDAFAAKMTETATKDGVQVSSTPCCQATGRGCVTCSTCPPPHTATGHNQPT